MTYLMMHPEDKYRQHGGRGGQHHHGSQVYACSKEMIYVKAVKYH